MRRDRENDWGGGETLWVCDESSFLGSEDDTGRPGAQGAFTGSQNRGVALAFPPGFLLAVNAASSCIHPSPSVPQPFEGNQFHYHSFSITRIPPYPVSHRGHHHHEEPPRRSSAPRGFHFPLSHVAEPIPTTCSADVPPSAFASRRHDSFEEISATGG